MTHLMAHMIPYFPDYPTSLEAARALIDAGVSFLEIQFPFSDPTADGPTIEAACTTALAQGFSVDRGFEFVKALAGRGPEIVIMTYASLVISRGVDRFCRDAAAAGASGVIVPDLPVDSDEGLWKAAEKAGLTVIPVIVPTTSEERLQKIAGVNPRYIYCALRTGITGTRTELGAENLAFLDRAGRTGAKILAGFGIQSPEQVRTLKGHVHGAIVGSALVRVISQAASPEACYESLLGVAQELVRA